MRTLPCENCITLAICKAIAHETDFKDVLSVLTTGNKLATKCTPIASYMLPAGNDNLKPQFDMSELQVVLRFLTGYKGEETENYLDVNMYTYTSPGDKSI